MKKLLFLMWMLCVNAYADVTPLKDLVAITTKKQISSYFQGCKKADGVAPLYGHIGEMLYNGRSVKMAVVVTDKNSPKAKASFIESYFYSLVMQEILTFCSGYDSFAMVERSDLDRVLNEKKISFTDTVDNAYLQTAKILDVNYILYEDIFPTYDDGGNLSLMIEIAKLVNVSNGQILASWTSSNKKLK